MHPTAEDMAKKDKSVRKKIINLYDFYWQTELAEQRYKLIMEKLGLEIKKDFDLFDFFGEIEADKNGEFEISTGHLTITGFQDENGKQQINFYFDLASN